MKWAYIGYEDLQPWTLRNIRVDNLKTKPAAYPERVAEHISLETITN
jgi:hypothetical protein